VGIAHLTVKSEIVPMTHLFEPLSIRDVTFRNRIAVAPMCQYSSQDGYANDWHLVHLTSRAVGGAGLVLTEAAAVEPKGRISPDDLGIWSDGHAEALAKIVTMIHRFGAVAGIQLAHAGRKASTAKPSEGGKALDETQGGWRPIVGPSAIAFSDDSPIPEALSIEGIGQITDAFVQAARRSLEAGFKVVEIMPLTATCCMSFSRRFLTTGRMSMGVALKTVPVCSERWFRECGKFGLKSIRSGCVSLQPIGWIMAGTLNKVLL
jgi:hypothetical protein